MLLILTTADTEIQALAAAVRRLPEGFEPVRARHANDLLKPEALDRFVADELTTGPGPSSSASSAAKSYFADGFERLSRECRARGIAFIALPGEQGLDPELTALCHAPLPLVTQVLEYFTQGGVANLVNLLRCLSDNVLMTGHRLRAARPPAPRRDLSPRRPRGDDGRSLAGEVPPSPAGRPSASSSIGPTGWPATWRRSTP